MIVVVLHALVAVVAFGGIALSGFYASMARHPGRPGVIEELRRYYAAPLRAEAAVVSVGLLGALALGLDPGGGGFAHAWVSGAVILWSAASALWVGVVRPAERALRAALEQAGPDVGETLRCPGRRLAWAAAVTDVIFVVALGLMIYQPG